jgi:hypothetical protein
MSDLTSYCPAHDDIPGREAYRKELIKEIRQRGIKISDTVKFDEARRIFGEMLGKEKK